MYKPFFLQYLPKSNNPKGGNSNKRAMTVNSKFHVVMETYTLSEYLGKDIEEYCNSIVSFIRESDLSVPLKTQVLSNIDVINYKGFTIIRIKIPSQKELSYLGEDTFIRKGNSTERLKTAKEIASVMNNFM